MDCIGTSGLPGVISTDAWDINELGQIAVVGSDNNGHTRGYLLAPVPLPATAWLMASSLCALFSARKVFRRLA